RGSNINAKQVRHVASSISESRAILPPQPAVAKPRAEIRARLAACGLTHAANIALSDPTVD
ncbi:MAG: hypothetical protein QF408_16330, partial [Pirellulales bacterium]|nr:hypothetical protein [Pirellulales bacterium]